MTSYAAFLRGINLGPTNKIAMPRLRQIAESLGYGEVKTHINSGNLLFASDKPAETVEKEVRDAIREELGLSIDVAVRTQDELGQVLAANPYPDGDPSRVTVAFLTGPPASDAKERVAALARDHEPFAFGEREVYVNYTEGQANSKLAEQFSKVVGVSSTVRNLNTVTKVLAMLDRI